MALLLDGKKRSKELVAKYQQAIEKLHSQSIYPKLVVITVGQDPASQVYVGQKEKRALQIGMDFEWVRLPEETTQDELIALLEKMNTDPTISGFIVQFPLPKHIDPEVIMVTIAADKDVEGFHPYTVGEQFYNRTPIVPCTPKGVIDILEANNIPIEGQNVVVIGKSHIVGMPLTVQFMNRDATVTTCHIKTKDFSEFTKNADIIVVAAGVPNLLRGEHVKEGVTVVDVGINRMPDGKIRGDVAFEEVEPLAHAITPVPGGVGPMTVAMLMQQTIICACLQAGVDPADYI